MKKFYLKFFQKKYILMGLSVSIIFFIFLSPLPVFAEDVKLQIPIGDTKSIPVCSGGLCHGIALYIVEFAKWFVSAIAILAVVAIMFGGIIWLTSRAEQKQVDFAKKLIQDSLIALGMVLGSYLFLSMISPDLVNFKGINIEEIEGVDFDAPDPGQMLANPNYGSKAPPAGLSHSGPATAADVRQYSHPNIVGKDAHGKLLKGTAPILEQAADICQKKYNLKIPITEALRTIQEQEQLFARYGAKRACNPHKYPDRVSCPHTSGAAVDITTKPMNDTDYVHMAECMKEAGFCRLTGGAPCEGWHFEYPKLSGSCNFNFDPSYRVPNLDDNTARAKYCSSPH